MTDTIKSTEALLPLFESKNLPKIALYLLSQHSEIKNKSEQITGTVLEALNRLVFQNKDVSTIKSSHYLFENLNSGKFSNFHEYDLISYYNKDILTIDTTFEVKDSNLTIIDEKYITGKIFLTTKINFVVDFSKGINVDIKYSFYY